MEVLKREIFQVQVEKLGGRGDNKISNNKFQSFSLQKHFLPRTVHPLFSSKFLSENSSTNLELEKFQNWGKKSTATRWGKVSSPRLDTFCRASYLSSYDIDWRPDEMIVFFMSTITYYHCSSLVPKVRCFNIWSLAVSSGNYLKTRSKTEKVKDKSLPLTSLLAPKEAKSAQTFQEA